MATQTAPGSGITVNTYGSSTYADMVKKEYIRRLEKEAQASTYFARFTGEIDKYHTVPEAAIMRKADLTKGGGDALNIPMLMNIDPTVIYGDKVLIGNEQAQALYNLEVKVNQWRTAVSGPAGNAAFRIKYLNMLKQVKPNLLRAIARELDTEHFRALNEGYSLNIIGSTTTGALGLAVSYHRLMYGAGTNLRFLPSVTSIMSAVEVSCTWGVVCTWQLDLDSIDALKALGKTNNIVPLNFQGGWWVLLVHPNVTHSIQTGSSNAWRAGVEYAAQRGRDNPFFTGATWAYNGIILHEHRDCPSVVSQGKSVTWGYGASNTGTYKVSYVLGKGSMAFAEGTGWSFPEEMYDYKNQRSMAAAKIFGIRRADFIDGAHSSYQTQSSMMVFSYAPNPSL